MFLLTTAYAPLFGIQHDMWYALPLIVSISLVYAASRHEVMQEILRHAARVGAWILGFMAVVFGILALISLRV